MAMVAGAVTQTIGRTVEGLGYEFVDAERLGGGLLRVTIDRDGGVQLADCERVSRQLTHVLAVENVDYARLEVSSPGLDRPLKHARDFARFAGAEAQVQLYAPLAGAGGRRRLHGRLLEVVSGTERRARADAARRRRGCRRFGPRRDEARRAFVGQSDEEGGGCGRRIRARRR